MKVLTERYMIELDTPEEYLSFLGNRIIYLKTVFVSGKGKRKTQIQRDFEQLEEYLERKDKYKEYFSILNGRKSFSKTDPDAKAISGFFQKKGYVENTTHPNEL